MNLPIYVYLFGFPLCFLICFLGVMRESKTLQTLYCVLFMALLSNLWNCLFENEWKGLAWSLIHVWVALCIAHLLKSEKHIVGGFGLGAAVSMFLLYLA